MFLNQLRRWATSGRIFPPPNRPWLSDCDDRKMEHAVITLRSLMRQDDGTLQQSTMTTSGWLESHPELPNHVVIWGNPERTEKGLGLPTDDLISVTPIPSKPYE